MLLSRWVGASRPSWTLTGGEMQRGESPEEAAVRRTLAETGYEVRIGRLHGVTSRVYRASALTSGDGVHDLHAIDLFYEATVIDGELRDPDPIVTGTDRAGWFPRGDLPAGRVRPVDSGLKFFPPAD